MNKRITALALIFIFMSILTGCMEIAEELPLETREVIQTEAHYPVEIGAMTFDESPISVASLSPALTEIICELGYGDLLTGVSIYCDYPENISSRVHIGSAANPDVDVIIGIKPDLLISMSPIAKKDIVSLEESGTRVLIIHAPATIDALYDIYHDIAAIFGGRLNAVSEAEEAVSPLKKALAEAENSVDSFVYIMDNMLSVAPPDTFIGNFFSHFGENIITESGRMNIGAEELAELSPGYIFVTPESSPEDFSNIQDARVIVIDYSSIQRLERPSSRLSGVVHEISEKINEVLE